MRANGRIISSESRCLYHDRGPFGIHSPKKALFSFGITSIQQHIEQIICILRSLFHFFQAHANYYNQTYTGLVCNINFPLQSRSLSLSFSLYPAYIYGRLCGPFASVCVLSVFMRSFIFFRSANSGIHCWMTVKSPVVKQKGAIRLRQWNFILLYFFKQNDIFVTD